MSRNADSIIPIARENQPSARLSGAGFRAGNNGQRGAEEMGAIGGMRCDSGSPCCAARVALPAPGGSVRAVCDPGTRDAPSPFEPALFLHRRPFGSGRGWRRDETT
jgi:hypothetical protein